MYIDVCRSVFMDINVYVCVYKYVNVYPSLGWCHHQGHFPLPEELILCGYYVKAIEIYSDTASRWKCRGKLSDRYIINKQSQNHVRTTEIYSNMSNAYLPQNKGNKKGAGDMTMLN